MGAPSRYAGSIWTLPFGKIRFTSSTRHQRASSRIAAFFSAWTEEMPEVIALNHVFIVLNFLLRSSAFRVPVTMWSLLRTDLYSESSCFKTGDLCLEFCNQPVCRIKAFATWIPFSRTQRTSSACVASDSNPSTLQ